jgi:hypothetical protein
LEAYSSGRGTGRKHSVVVSIDPELAGDQRSDFPRVVKLASIDAVNDDGIVSSVNGHLTAFGLLVDDMGRHVDLGRDVSGALGVRAWLGEVVAHETERIVGNIHVRGEVLVRLNVFLDGHHPPGGGGPEKFAIVEADAGRVEDLALHVPIFTVKRPTELDQGVMNVSTVHEPLKLSVSGVRHGWEELIWDWFENV